MAGMDLALAEKVLQFWIVERCGSGFLCLKLDALGSFVRHSERKWPLPRTESVDLIFKCVPLRCCHFFQERALWL